MYLPTMNALDILRLYDCEKIDCEAKLAHVYEEKRKQLRQYLSSHPSVTYACYWKHPKSQSEYMLCLYIRSKKELNRPGFFYLPIIQERGINVVLLSTFYGAQAMMFTSHFFDRYNERMGLGEPDKIKVAAHFLVKNWQYGDTSAEKIRKGKMEYEIKLPEGAAMCNWNPDRAILSAKTFIREDMYYQAQRNRLDTIELNNTKNSQALKMRLEALAERGVL